MENEFFDWIGKFNYSTNIQEGRPHQPRKLQVTQIYKLFIRTITNRLENTFEM